MVVRALEGALEVIRAKHARWPPNKLKHLKAGVSVLDSLVAVAPGSPQVRYLRLASCYSLPFFLSRDKSVKEDLAFLAAYLPDQDGAFSPPVHRLVLEFVLGANSLDPDQRLRIEEALTRGL
jgi:hypothetical protein